MGFVVFTFDQIYIKHAVDGVKMDSNWGRVYYTNMIASAPLLLSSSREYAASLGAMAWSVQSVGALSLSCALGVAMSYFAFLARKSVSATSFTIIGNVCKVITIIINIFLWDKHANGSGLMALAGSLVCAFFYQQAPLRHILPETVGVCMSRMLHI